MADISAAGFADIDLLAINTWCHINPAVLASDFDKTLAGAEAVFKKHRLSMKAMNVGFSCQMHDRRPASVRQNLGECEAICKFMDYFGAKTASLQPLQNDPLRNKGAALDEALGDCIASLGEYYGCMSAHGIKLGLELHVNSPFENRAAVERLLAEIPGAGIAYDPSHQAMQGIGLEESEFTMKNTVHAHLRDAGPGEMQTKVGKGAVDFEWVMRKLAENGYAGMYSIEFLDNAEWDALAEAKKLMDVLSP